MVIVINNDLEVNLKWIVNSLEFIIQLLGGLEEYIILLVIRPSLP